ncbi:MAG: FFLEELY motif protein [Candidatus Levyibacteriota bacterium]
MTDTASHDAVHALLTALERVQRHHAERAARPDLAAALTRICDWQARRLRCSYQDLEAQPRYQAAIEFFETDLYGGADFAQRDADLARVVPLFKRLLPAKVTATVATAVELNALSQDLDRALVDALVARDAGFSVADYCAAYRRMGQYDRRTSQIRLVGDVGIALDRYVQMPMLRGALKLMRKPAQAAGLGALQNFLERGFAAFARMDGAVEFLATIETRERAIHDAIVAGSNAPFPDPLA